MITEDECTEREKRNKRKNECDASIIHSVDSLYQRREEVRKVNGRDVKQMSLLLQ